MHGVARSTPTPARSPDALRRRRRALAAQLRQQAVAAQRQGHDPAPVLDDIERIIEQIEARAQDRAQRAA